MKSFMVNLSYFFTHLSLIHFVNTAPGLRFKSLPKSEVGKLVVACCCLMSFSTDSCATVYTCFLYPWTTQVQLVTLYLHKLGPGFKSHLISKVGSMPALPDEYECIKS